MGAPQKIKVIYFSKTSSTVTYESHGVSGLKLCVLPMVCFFFFLIFKQTAYHLPLPTAITWYIISANETGDL